MSANVNLSINNNPSKTPKCQIRNKFGSNITNKNNFLYSLSKGKIEVAGVFTTFSPTNKPITKNNEIELDLIQLALKNKIHEMTQISQFGLIKNTLSNAFQSNKNFSNNNSENDFNKKSELKKNKKQSKENLKQHHSIVSPDKYRFLDRKKVIYDSVSDETTDDEFDSNIFFYISPDDKRILFLDTAILIISIYSLIYIPLNLALSKCMAKYSIINILNYFLDLIYIVDFVISFFRPYYNIEEKLIINSNKIIIHYLKTDFFVDFISAIPFFSIFNFMNKEYCYDTIDFNNYLNNMYRLLETLKFLKIFKIYQEKINGALENMIITLDQYQFFDNRGIFIIIFFTLCTLHLTSCLHIFFSRNSYPNWILNQKLIDSHFIRVYLNSIYFVITTLSTVGYGDITGNTITEIAFQILLLIIGIIAYSWVISYISNYIRDRNKLLEVFDYNVKILESIKQQYPNINKVLYSKIFRHLEYTYLKETKHQELLIDSLPLSLKNNLLIEMFKPVINNLNFFKNVKNSDFILKILPKLLPVLADKNDILIDKGELVEQMILVKEGRLTIEIKIDIDDPEGSINDLLNDEIFGTTINPFEDKSFMDNSINSLSPNSRNFTLNNFKINKTNTFMNSNEMNKNKNKKDKNNNFLLEYKEEIINYMHLKILDIRKNEHFGGLLMFLNKTTQLTLRVKSTKAELYYLKKTDAVEISSNYPNIWKRINKISLHNLKQITKNMRRIIKQYCDSYGIQYSLLNININEKRKGNILGYQQQLKSENSMELKSLNISNNISETINTNVEENNINNNDAIINKNKFQMNNEKKSSFSSNKLNLSSNVKTNSNIHSNVHSNVHSNIHSKGNSQLSESDNNGSNISLKNKNPLPHPHPHPHPQFNSSSGLKNNYIFKNTKSKITNINDYITKETNSCKVINDLLDKTRLIMASTFPKRPKSVFKRNTVYIGNVSNKRINRFSRNKISFNKSISLPGLGKNFTMQNNYTSEKKLIVFEISKQHEIEISSKYSNLNQLSNYNFIKDIIFQKKISDMITKEYTDKKESSSSIKSSSNSNNSNDKSNYNSIYNSNYNINFNSNYNSICNDCDIELSKKSIDNKINSPEKKFSETPKKVDSRKCVRNEVKFRSEIVDRINIKKKAKKKLVLIQVD